jgi:hypothetical protein
MLTLSNPLITITQNEMPLDLRLWVDPFRLVCLTLEATTEISEASIDIPGFNKGSTDRRPRQLLAVLTYCYAIGSLSSQEIERLVQSDDMVRYLAANSSPTCDELRIFRRRWKLIIKQSLVSLLILVWRARSLAPAASEPLIKRGDQPGLAPTVPSDLLRQFLCEADQRIYQAVRLDTMELDF